MRVNIVLTVLVVLLLTASVVHAGFDNTTKRYGIQINTGINLTKGRDYNKNVVDDIFGREFGIDLSKFHVDKGLGLTLAFGVSAKIGIVEGFYLEPSLHMSIYKEKVESDSMLYPCNHEQYLCYAPGEYKWTTRDISISVTPQYIFRIIGSPVHPFAGITLGLDIFHSGDLEYDLPGVGSGKEKASSAWEVDGESQATKTGFLLGFVGGSEFILGPKIAIPLTIVYELRMAEYVSNVLKIHTGFTFYF